MAKKYYCPVCGYESDEPIDVCPVCGAKMAVREEGETSWAAEHKGRHYRRCQRRNCKRPS